MLGFLLLIVAPIVTMIAGICVLKSDIGRWLDYGMELIAIIAIVVAALVLIISLICAIECRVQIVGRMERFKGVRDTVVSYRSGISEMGTSTIAERAAIGQIVAEQNGWLRQTLYWARHPVFSIFYPKSVLELKPISVPI